MEKVLDFMYFAKDGAAKPFPDAENQIRISDFTYSAQRMGGAPVITAKVMYKECLDNVWNEYVFVSFNGERYFLKNTPTSSKSNVDHRYTHNVEMVSERIILDNVYFYDVVEADFDDYKPVTNSATVFFFGSVRDFVKRLNASLRYAKIGKSEANPSGYEVVVDTDVTNEEKQITFENQFFTNVLQEIYNTFKVPYYFEGKTIHVGNYAKNRELEKVSFEYGADKNLISVTKTNSNNKIVNRIAAEGSKDNIPYYYPNDTPFGSLTTESNGKFTVSLNNERFRNRVKLDDKFIFKGKEEAYLTNRNPDVIVQKIDARHSILAYTFNGFPERKTDVYITPPGPASGVVGLEIEISELLSYGTEIKSLAKKTWSSSEGFDRIDFRLQLQKKDDSIYLLDVKQKHSSDIDDSNLKMQAEIEVYSFGWYKEDKIADINYYGISVVGDARVDDYISVVQEPGSHVKPTGRLMPPIYRETFGGERFYNAENNKYTTTSEEKKKILFDSGKVVLLDNGKPIFFDASSYYAFDNLYLGANPKEHLEIFDDIKPTIVGITNSYYHRIDQFLDVAFDDDDNNEKEEKDGQLVYKHPYFYVRLHKFDGDNGFNLFDCAIDESEMTFNMTSGHCGACAFKVMVSQDKQENLLQVNPDGTLKKENGRAVFGAPQDVQNDTINNNVWIALLKDDSTYGEQVMPESKVYVPTTEDTFVITHIQLPKGYILAAEERLKEAAISYMAMNNSEIFNFSIKMSRIYLEQHPEVLTNLTENSRIAVRYNGLTYMLYVSSYSYKMSSNEILPEISVELKDSITVVKNAIQNAIGAVQQNVMMQIATMDIVGSVTPYFVSKLDDDNVSGQLTFSKRQKFDGGAAFGKNAFIDQNGNAEVENLVVKNSLTTMELVFNRLAAIEGDLVLTEIDTISEAYKIGTNTYRLFLQSKWDGYFTAQAKNNIIKGVINTLASGSGVFKTSWMRVNAVNVSQNYIDVTLFGDADTPSGRNFPPCAMMKIVRMGNQTDIDRQRSIYISSNEGRMSFLDHVTSPKFSDKNYQLILGHLPKMAITERLGLIDKLGLYSQTVLCEKLFRIDWNGDLTTVPVDRGAWVPNPSKPYRYIQNGDSVLEQHFVTHYGCKYACMKDQTTEEPTWETTDWALVEGDGEYKISIESSNGTQFMIPNIDTTLSIVITRANRVITDSVLSRPNTAVKWERSIPGNWSPRTDNGSIHITRDDMGEGWGKSYFDVGFSCTVTFFDGIQKITLQQNI